MAVRRFLEAVNYSYVGMVERTGGARLAQKTLAVVAARSDMLGKKLERDGPLKFDIERAIDDAHPTGPGFAEDSVIADEISHGQRGVWIRHQASPKGVQPREG